MLTATHKSNLAKVLGAMGEKGDTMVAHINPQEAALLQALGGAGTRNPKTGLPQFNQVGPGGAGGPGSQGGLGGANGDALGGGGGNIGGYGGGPGNQNGSGLGANGGNSGNFAGHYIPYTYTPMPMQAAPAPAAAPPPAPPPVTTAPLMSAAQPTLVGSQYGALPAWATASYQIGTAPTSYPVPGRNTAGGAGSGGAGAGGVPGLGGNNGASGAANGGALPAIGSPQAIASGIGISPYTGQPMQATANAPAPYMQKIYQELGIHFNPVAHQYYENRNAASYGATAGNLSVPQPIQGAAQTPVQHQGASGFNLIGSAPKTTLPKPTVVQPTKQAPTQTGFNIIGSNKYQSTGRGSPRNQ